MSVGFTFIMRIHKEAVVLSQLGLATENRSDGNVVVRSPCSTSNLGPGYDVFGLALDALHDTVEVSFLEKDEIVVEVQGVYSKNIPVEIDLNSAGRTAIEFSRRYGAFGCRIKVEKGIPPGSGLGSSGASAAGTAVALNLLLGLKLEKQELVDIAAQGEIAAAGAAHADNVAPAIYGGFVVIRSYNPVQVLSLTPPKDFDFAIALPLGTKKTTKKRHSRECTDLLSGSEYWSRVLHRSWIAAVILIYLARECSEARYSNHQEHLCILDISKQKKRHWTAELSESIAFSHGLTPSVVDPC